MFEQAYTELLKENEDLRNEVKSLKDKGKKLEEFMNKTKEKVEELWKERKTNTIEPEDDKEEEFIGERIYKKIKEIQQITNENEKTIEDLKYYLENSTEKTDACEKYIFNLTKNFINENERIGQYIDTIKKKTIPELKEEVNEEAEYGDIEMNRIMWELLKENHNLLQDKIDRKTRILIDQWQEWRELAKDMAYDIESYDENIFGTIIDKKLPINIRHLWEEFKIRYENLQQNQINQQNNEDCNQKWITTCEYMLAIRDCYCLDIPRYM